MQSETTGTGPAQSSIDLNADVGEHDDPSAVDVGLLGSLSSATVACGFHAGNVDVMLATVQRALRLGLAIGAHPSYDDREGFGRRQLEVDPARLADDIGEQLRTLQKVATSCDASVVYVKPHGALYNRVSVDRSFAKLVADAVKQFDDMALLVQAGSVAVEAGLEAGLRVFTEAFCDRSYMSDGTLAPRATEGSVLHDAEDVAAQAVKLATEHRVRALDGTWLTIEASSLCLHGDTPGAAALAASVRRALEGAGVRIAAFAL